MNELETLLRSPFAGEYEFQSWLDVINEARFFHCPDGQRHKDEPVDLSTGYAFRCIRCGHHSIFPF